MLCIYYITLLKLFQIRILTFIPKSGIIVFDRGCTMLNTIINKFKSIVPCSWEPSNEQLDNLKQLLLYASKNGFDILIADADKVLLEAVNQKLALNSSAYKKLLDIAYLYKVKLNYMQKTKIKLMLDSSDVGGYIHFLKENNIYSIQMLNAFSPVTTEMTFKAIDNLLATDKQSPDVCLSIFSRFCFNLFPKECVYRFFSNNTNAKNDFFDFIDDLYPDLGNRTTALTIIDISIDLFQNGYIKGCNKVLNAIKNSYLNLSNHCDMAIIIPPIMIDGEDIQWKLYADCILYAEKHIKEKIDKAYFRWQKIGAQTMAHIPQIVPFNAEFEYVFQGFVFKDCFVIQDEENSYLLLLIFEKNQRDERVINCPACRTGNVQGNSYPILNVKSWECQNPLCPDRSKYNRGKRYAYMSLFRQKETMNDENIIPEVSISKWRLDCQSYTPKNQVLEMIIRHYSCYNDGVSIFTQDLFDGKYYDRHIRTESFSDPRVNLLSSFKNSSYFYRYIQYDDTEKNVVSEWTYDKAKIIYSDALYAIRQFDSEIFSGAVTSPPYYNAKTYSQWQNIYCYLYDMYNISLEIFRVLKTGGIYLFNIFDYFDNENNVALSAMGNKRMILGAYMIDIFERIGFTICGNIIWNKGEIQGNRSFNQGNLTPYYQAPLNCWEHILILSKGKPNQKFDKLVSRIENIKPVIKIINGKNIIGHDAPYPQEIPNLLLKYMTKEDLILDPFLGSGTTCIAANKYGVQSVGIEKNAKYFELCKFSIISNTRK